MKNFSSTGLPEKDFEAIKRCLIYKESLFSYQKKLVEIRNRMAHETLGPTCDTLKAQQCKIILSVSNNSEALSWKERRGASHRAGVKTREFYVGLLDTAQYCVRINR